MDTDYCLVQWQAGGKAELQPQPKAKEGFDVNTWTPSTQGWGWPCSEHPPRPCSSAPSDHWCLPKAWESCIRSIRTGALLVLSIPGALSSLWKSKAGGWRLHVSWSHAPNQVPLFQYLADRSISSRDKKSPLENTIFNFLFISGMQARLGTLKTWHCNNLFCPFLLLFSFFFSFSKSGNTAFIPLWKAWSEQTGTNDTSAAKIVWRKPKPKCKRLKRQLPHKPND